MNSSNLMVTLYDNGEVDGDTVSVLLNGKVIMPMQGLSTRAINKTIYFAQGLGDSVILLCMQKTLAAFLRTQACWWFRMGTIFMKFDLVVPCKKMLP
ncbi:MAG: hypothetical protein ABI472_00655 [Ginsengibacter sp.]